MIITIIICFIISFVLRRGSLRIPYRTATSPQRLISPPVRPNKNYKIMDRWVMKYISTEMENCPICCEELKTKSKLVKLPDCNHFFHKNCIKNWMKVKALCPICKADYNGYFEA